MEAGLAALIIALVLSLILGVLLIPLLRRRRLGQMIRSDGPARHLAKAGTPTIGGLIFLPAVVVAALLISYPSADMVTVLLLMVSFASVGLADDLLKLVHKQSMGLKARHKLVAQAALGLAFGLVVVTYLGRFPILTAPLGLGRFDLGWFYPVFVMLVVMASTNATNLTDGLDGLAGGVTFFVAISYLLITVMLGRTDLAVVAGALAGGCLGFLVFNYYPARVFMGDMGSLALGAGVAALAVVSGTELLLPVIGGVYLLEALSVILQVASFQLRGRRILLMSPLHHHFELAGWSEVKVAAYFWLVSLLLGALGTYLFMTM